MFSANYAENRYELRNFRIVFEKPKKTYLFTQNYRSFTGCNAQKLIKRIIKKSVVCLKMGISEITFLIINWFFNTKMNKKLGYIYREPQIIFQRTACGSRVTVWPPLV